MKANYEKFGAFLESGADKQVLSFPQIEMIIGEEISPVYINRRTFKQSNSRFRIAANSVGFEITNVDYELSFATFERAEPRYAVANNQPRQPIVFEGELGRNLDEAVAVFKASWSSTGGQYVPFCDKYDQLNDVYYHAGMEAYRASVRRAIKFNGLPRNDINALREQSCRYLAEQFVVLFDKDEMDFNIFNQWAHETTMHIRQIYRDAGVNDYTVGNAQKLINVAMKFVMSSNIVDYTNDVFKYCHFPVDAVIQKVIKRQLRENYLKNNGEPSRYCTSWSNNDNWDDFLDYQTRVRNAILLRGFYSPIIWEATHWNPQN